MYTYVVLTVHNLPGPLPFLLSHQAYVPHLPSGYKPARRTLHDSDSQPRPIMYKSRRGCEDLGMQVFPSRLPSFPVSLSYIC